MADKIKVLLVDDHAVVRAGFKLLLATTEHIEVVAEAERGEQAIQHYLSNDVDIVVMDISMPGIGGLETIRRLMQRDDQVKILVFSVHHEQVFIHRALHAGAKGYISKNSAPEMLPEAITSIMHGHDYIEPALLTANERSPQQIDYHSILETFTDREFDIFRLLVKGGTAHDIAEQQCLGYKTVANYITQIKKKLHAGSVSELMKIAHLLGISITSE